MSKHQVDEITNAAGTGAPDFPQGLSTDGSSVLRYTDWVSYTPTIGATTTAPSLGTNTISAFYRRVGDSLEIRMSITSSGGSGGSGTYLVPIPGGFTIDSGKINAPANTTSNNAYCGTAQFTNPTDTMIGHAQVYDTSNLYVRGIFDSGEGIWGSSFFAFQAGATQFGLQVTVPIT